MLISTNNESCFKIIWLSILAPKIYFAHIYFRCIIQPWIVSSYLPTNLKVLQFTTHNDFPYGTWWRKRTQGQRFLWLEKRRKCYCFIPIDQKPKISNLVSGILTPTYILDLYLSKKNWDSFYSGFQQRVLRIKCHSWIWRPLSSSQGILCSLAICACH